MSALRLQPVRHVGTFAFVSVPTDVDVAGLDIVAAMQEAEGLTLVLPQEQAAACGYEVMFRCAWITLQLPSALDATGLTAQFARALANADIAGNVIAGAHHDHLFVPIERGDDAVAVLSSLQWQDGSRADGMQAARDRIDALDEQLVELLALRMREVAAIGEAKAASGERPVVDPGRQREVEQAWRANAEARGLSAGLADRVLREVLDQSRRDQERLQRGCD